MEEVSLGFLSTALAFTVSLNNQDPSTIFFSAEEKESSFSMEISRRHVEVSKAIKEKTCGPFWPETCTVVQI